LGKILLFTAPPIISIASILGLAASNKINDTHLKVGLGGSGIATLIGSEASLMAMSDPYKKPRRIADKLSEEKRV
jgi:hypothetical protein